MMRKYSHSALKVWQRCQRKWKYRYIDRLEPVEVHPAIERGKNLHDGLEMYHTFDTKFAQWMLDADPDDVDILVRYAEKYEDEDDWKVLHAEEDLEVQVGPYTVVFKPDLIIEINDEVWIVDHKTTKTIPDEWDDYNMTDFQHLLYIYGVQKLFPEYNVRGFIFNYIRTKPPAMPKLIKDGSRVADVRRLDTTADILEGFLEATGVDDPDAREKVKILRHAPDKYFQRHFLMAPPEAIAQVEADVLAVLSEMSAKEHGRARGTYARHVVSGWGGASACSRCEYKALCYGEMMGMNTQPILLQYKEREKR